MIPVECARAFGGVEIGRVMARDAHIATPTMRLTALSISAEAAENEPEAVMTSTGSTLP